MAEGDRKTLVFRTSADFTAAWRNLDAEIDRMAAEKEVLTRCRKIEDAGKSAAEMARLYQQLSDLVLDELERHWGPQLLEGDPTIPDFPDGWNLVLHGRILRMDYNERAAFRGK